jgi:dimethylhistidine N-methyltransferase
MSPDDLLQSFDDLAPETDDFLSEVMKGLSARPKTLPCKFFYDEQGSRLFDRICELPEYYPTRTEIALLEQIGPEIAERVGPHAHIVEYGCGSVKKIRPLLDALVEPAAYVAVDISREHLIASAGMLAEDYPNLDVHAVCADFTKPFNVKAPVHHVNARRVGFFPGSTIGNFQPDDALRFLANATTFLGPGGAMIIGIDLKKDVAILNTAYNDSQGITAAFNLNLLDRINRELEADFDLAKFRHKAHFNEVAGRVEMHLYSLADQSVHINGSSVAFAKGESIHTENSHKYSVDEFQAMARSAGFVPDHVWVDDGQLFSIHYLTVPA